MQFNISAFIHIGTVRKLNQDSILVNGRVIFEEGELHIFNSNECRCFVADGMGFHSGSGSAAKFILEFVSKLKYRDRMQFLRELVGLNTKLISKLANYNQIGAGTTLTGVLLEQNLFEVFHIGDSEIWLLRSVEKTNIFQKITNDQRLENDKHKLTNYYGGSDGLVRFDNQVKLKSIQKADILVICTDGLFKAMGMAKIKQILLEKVALKDRMSQIREECLKFEAPDNIGVILIEVF